MNELFFNIFFPFQLQFLDTSIFVLSLVFLEEILVVLPVIDPPVLQMLEQLKLVEKNPIGGCRLSSQGRRDLNRIACQNLDMCNTDFYIQLLSTITKKMCFCEENPIFGLTHTHDTPCVFFR